eukprot:165669_1
MMYCSTECRDRHAVYGISPHVHKCEIFRSSFINAMEKRKYFEQFAITKTAKMIYTKAVSHVLHASIKNQSNMNMDSWATFWEIFDCNLDVTLCMSDPMTVYYIIKTIYLHGLHANQNNEYINIYLLG